MFYFYFMIPRHSHKVYTQGAESGSVVPATPHDNVSNTSRSCFEAGGRFRPQYLYNLDFYFTRNMATMHDTSLIIRTGIATNNSSVSFNPHQKYNDNGTIETLTYYAKEKVTAIGSRWSMMLIKVLWEYLVIRTNVDIGGYLSRHEIKVNDVFVSGIASPTTSMNIDSTLYGSFMILAIAAELVFEHQTDYNHVLAVSIGWGTESAPHSSYLMSAIGVGGTKASSTTNSYFKAGFHYRF